MAVPSSARPSQTPSLSLASDLYRLTVRQYEGLIEYGAIDESDRVELIEGLLVAQRRRTRAFIVAGNRGLRILWRILPPGWYVAKGVPIIASDWSKPKPDLAIVRGVVEDYDEHGLTSEDVALVVEIAESNLPTDRAEMNRVYAAANIPVYWIVNLIEDQVEIWSEPGQDGYHAYHVLRRGQDLPVVIGGVEAGWIAAADILP